jgi:hypothetical protein
MTHPDPVEIHDHVYGFRNSDHVPACPECRTAADRLAAERLALRAALAQPLEAPPAGLVPTARPFPWLAFAAAATLLVGLVALLQPAAPTAPSSPHDGEIRRLVAELRSQNPRRRDLALLALRAYGAQAHPFLVQAGADPALAGEFRTPSADDAAKLDSLLVPRLSLSYDQTPLPEVLAFLASKCPIPVLVDDAVPPDEIRLRKVSFLVTDLPLLHCYQLLLGPQELAVHVLDGKLRIARPRVFMTSRLPVRIGPDDPAAADLVRKQAWDELRRLDFAAEKALWAALDTPSAEPAETLLRELYATDSKRGPAVPNADPALLRALDQQSITFFVEDEPLEKAADLLRQQTGLNIHVRNRDDSRPGLTFRCRNLPLRSALELLVDDGRGSRPVPSGKVVFLDPEGEPPGPSPDHGPFWLDVPTAREVEKCLATLDAPAGGVAAIGPLRTAARRLPEPAKSKARGLLLRVYRETGVRLADDPPAAYLASRTPEAQALLEHRYGTNAKEETLVGLLRTYGVNVRDDSPDQRKFTFVAPLASIRGLLDALTRPNLDWRMEGTTVVIDTPGNIRKAVEP